MLRHGRMSMRHLFPVQFCLRALEGFLKILHGSLICQGKCILSIALVLRCGLSLPCQDSTKKWSPGRVTDIQSAHVISVDGVPRHVRVVHKRQHSGCAADAEKLSSDLTAWWWWVQVVMTVLILSKNRIDPNCWGRKYWSPSWRTVSFTKLLMRVLEIPIRQSQRWHMWDIPHGYVDNRAGFLLCSSRFL